MRAHRLAQYRKGRGSRRNRSPRIHLLQCDQIRMMTPDYIDDACQIETTVGAEAAVDVPGHHANSGGAAGQAPPLRQRSINACAPSERESHAPIATRKKIMFVSVGFIRMLQI